MTNEMIILWESVDLMEQGIIGTTGRTFEVEDKDGNKRLLREPEPIHTFDGWKERGYAVKKGEHAVASFMIWKYISGKRNNEEAEAETVSVGGRCIMKKAFFFKTSQVEKIKRGAA